MPCVPAALPHGPVPRKIRSYAACAVVAVRTLAAACGSGAGASNTAALVKEMIR